ncbi:MAG TPA: TonB-dependent receptor, partial [Povalibacter sp.]|nr:TonB-dependent receptor [Povalibacter sp.]
HRQITNWETTSCATDGGNTTSAAGRECTAALTSAGIQNAKVAIPNAQLGQYMVPWTHSALYNTSDFDVGLNHGWALPNYRMLDPVVNIDYFENDLAVGLAGGVNVANYNPRIVDEETTGVFLEANGQLESLGKLRYNVGVRRIETDQFVSGHPTINSPLQVGNKTYDEYLPSFNIASDLTDGVVLRAAASRTMTRPNAGDIVPNGSLSINGDVFTIGNPELDPYFASNYDLGLEWYFGESGLGMVALDLWTKRLEGFTTTRSQTVPFGTLGIDFSTLPIATQTGIINTSTASGGGGNPDLAPVRVDQRQNTPEIIHLYGLEVTYVQPLDFLLPGAGFSVNYTNIAQYSTGAPAGAPSSAVTGLSPYTYNVTAFYEAHGFSGRVSYAFRDAYINFLGFNENNIQGDNWSQPSGYLDASCSYKLPWWSTDISVSLELQNITNEQQLVYFRDDASTPRASFAPGRQLLLGVTGSF